MNFKSTLDDVLAKLMHNWPVEADGHGFEPNAKIEKTHLFCSYMMPVMLLSHGYVYVDGGILYARKYSEDDKFYDLETGEAL